MRMSATEEYGLRCLLVLARHGTDGQMSVADIAQAGLVTAVRGRKGGFCISREPSEINLLEVITKLGGPLLDPDHCTKRTGQLEQCIHSDNCSVHDILGSLAGQIAGFLAGTTLNDLIKKERLMVLPRVDGDQSDASRIQG